MGLSHPLRKLKDLNQRFGALERSVAALHDRLSALENDVSGIREDTGSLAGAVDELRADIDLRTTDVLAATHAAESAGAKRSEELRDSVHLAARRATLNRPVTRALFLVHHIEAWGSCDELVRAMQRADDFDPVVASIPRHFAGSSALTHEEEVHAGLASRGIPHIRLPAHDHDEALRLVKWIEPDLVFRQSQWDADVPADLTTDRLTFARLCLVPYETMNLVINVPLGDERNTAVDATYHRAAWAVFCTNEMMLEMAQRDGARRGDQFHVVGHPKVDRHRNAQPSWPLERADLPDRRRVVWSAHHSIASGWIDFGTFPTTAEPMLSWAAEQSDTDFVFMPHPALAPFTTTGNSPVSRAAYEEWLARWRALPNTAVCEDGDYAPVLAASNLLITDGLSMLAEYQVHEKPILFIERPGHRPFNAIGEIVMTGAHTVSDVPEARRLAQRFLRGEPDLLRDQQEVNVRKLFGPGRAVERILDVLRTRIAEERLELAPRAHEAAAVRS